MPDDKHFIEPWLDDENLGSYAHKIDEWLTREESEALRVKITFYPHRVGSATLFGLQKIAEQVGDLSTCSQGNLAHWAFDGIRLVAEYEPQLSLDNRDNLTMAQVREAIEEEMADEDAEGWWDEDKVAAVRAWLSQTPYELWQLVHHVEGWTQDSLREHLLDMAREANHGHEVAREARKRWEKLVTEWLETWETARKESA